LPKIVNKEEKRKEIAKACIVLLDEVGIKKLTVSAAAKAANVGKGTIYEYFESKEDIIFAIIKIHIAENSEIILAKMKNALTTKDKLRCFFSFVIEDDEENLKHFNGYKEYLSVALADTTDGYKKFNAGCDEFFEEFLHKLIQEGIDKGELIPSSINFINSIVTYKKGLSLSKMTINNYNAKEEYEEFVDNFFALIEVKND